MNYLQALILSVVEGISEFLPISSTGHLVLVSNFLGLSQDQFVKSFEISIQFGAILAVVFLYWNTLITNFRIWKNIILAFIPTAVVGLVLYKFIKGILLGNVFITLLALFFGGILLIVLEKIHQEKDTHHDKIEDLKPVTAVMIGLIQSLSVVPGVSRSGASILGGLFLGLKRKTAVELSFLLAIPTVLGATVLDLYKSRSEFNSAELPIIAIGFIGSFVVALMVVKWFIKYVQSKNLIPFGIYRIIISILYWLIIIHV